MNEADWTIRLIQQAPYLAAIVIVVYLFLKYLHRWMDSWQVFFTEQRDSQNKVLQVVTENQSLATERLAAEIKAISALLLAHDEITRAAIARMEERTKPLPRKRRSE